jgi:hypothetical protein
MSWSGVCVVCCADRLCGGVAACLGVACMLCAVQNGTEFRMHGTAMKMKNIYLTKK